MVESVLGIICPSESSCGKCLVPVAQGTNHGSVNLSSQSQHTLQGLGCVYYAVLGENAGLGSVAVGDVTLALDDTCSNSGGDQLREHAALFAKLRVLIDTRARDAGLPPTHLQCGGLAPQHAGGFQRWNAVHGGVCL
jgi:hypothetical protein